MPRTSFVVPRTSQFLVPCRGPRGRLTTSGAPYGGPGGSPLGAPFRVALRWLFSLTRRRPPGAEAGSASGAERSEAGMLLGLPRIFIGIPRISLGFP